MTAARPRRPLRSDARINRDRLLLVAAARFAADGPGVSLEAVAKDAGVGIGTLYRHFPTRDALVEAVYRQEVERLCIAADELLLTHAPDAALAEWMQRFVAYAEAKRGLSGVLQSVMASNSGLLTNTRDRLTGAISTLLRAAVAAGTVRADMEPEDILLVMSGVWLIPDGERWHERARRLLQLVMDGLRHGATSG